jgi:DNA-binding phage protein
VTPIPIKDAIVESGGVNGLANKLGVTRQTIHRWLKLGAMPEVYQYAYIARRPKKGRVS